MAFRYARQRFVKAHPDTGVPHVFHYGQRVDADDPIVKASPGDFMTLEEWSRTGGHGVEEASARPGERRNR